MVESADDVGRHARRHDPAATLAVVPAAVTWMVDDVFGPTLSTDPVARVTTPADALSEDLRGR